MKFCYQQYLRYFSCEPKDPSRPQKFTKKGSERYLMFGPIWTKSCFSYAEVGYGCFPGHGNVCRWFLNRGGQISF